jgi:hypothetical protein
MNGEKGNTYKIFMGKPEGTRPLGRPRHKWVNNIKMHLRYDDVVLTDSGYGPVETFCEHGNEPSRSIICW